MRSATWDNIFSLLILASCFGKGYGTSLLTHFMMPLLRRPVRQPLSKLHSHVVHMTSSLSIKPFCLNLLTCQKALASSWHLNQTEIYCLLPVLVRRVPISRMNLAKLFSASFRISKREISGLILLFRVGCLSRSGSMGSIMCHEND